MPLGCLQILIRFFYKNPFNFPVAPCTMCRFEKLSGVDKGPDGYVKHWEVLRGVTGDGTVSRYCARGRGGAGGGG